MKRPKDIYLNSYLIGCKYPPVLLNYIKGFFMILLFAIYSG